MEKIENNPTKTFVVGDDVLVMNELKTKITKIIDDRYYFLDEKGGEYWEVVDAIERLPKEDKETNIEE